ncbi:hypothetical protein OMAG_001255, partial [Candidatus Omnitrophus magneticus]
QYLRDNAQSHGYTNEDITSSKYVTVNCFLSITIESSARFNTFS